MLLPFEVLLIAEPGTANPLAKFAFKLARAGEGERDPRLDAL